MLGPTVMDLEVVPFGNTKIENTTVSCQHGVAECDANTYEQCMIHSFPHPKQYLLMLSCLEDVLPMGSRSTKFPVDVFETCAMQANLDFSPIQDCHDSPVLAWKVLQEAADATPDYHDHVPWVEIDESTWMRRITISWKKFAKRTRPRVDLIQRATTKVR